MPWDRQLAQKSSIKLGRPATPTSTGHESGGEVYQFEYISPAHVMPAPARFRPHYKLFFQDTSCSQATSMMIFNERVLQVVLKLADELHFGRASLKPVQR